MNYLVGCGVNGFEAMIAIIASATVIYTIGGLPVLCYTGNSKPVSYVLSVFERHGVWLSAGLSLIINGLWFL